MCGVATTLHTPHNQCRAICQPCTVVRLHDCRNPIDILIGDSPSAEHIAEHAAEHTAEHIAEHIAEHRAERTAERTAERIAEHVAEHIL